MKKLSETIEWNDENVKNFWDFYSQYPEFYFTYQYGDEIVKTLWPFMKSNSNVLDYGCGTGFLIKSLVGKPIKVYGTDSSPASLAAVKEKFGAEKNFGGVFEIEQIIHDRKFEEFFDVVCLIEVVEHLSDNHLISVIMNIKKLLKKKGILIITTPNEEDLSTSLVYCPESKKVFHRWQHVRSWSDKTLESFLLKQGIDTIKVLTTNFSSIPSKSITVKSVLRSMFTKIGLLQKSTVSEPHLVYAGYKK